MNRRAKIKRQHEKYIVQEFLAWHKRRYRSKYEVIGWPDPPDAIARSKRRSLWIEHCDIYRNADEAREEYSAIVPGEKYVPHSEHPIADPDSRTAQSLLSTIRKKLARRSYSECVRKHGKGVLVTNERDPLFSDSTIHAIKAAVVSSAIDLSSTQFKAVYLGFRVWDQMAFERLLPARRKKRTT